MRVLFFILLFLILCAPGALAGINHPPSSWIGWVCYIGAVPFLLALIALVAWAIDSSSSPVVYVEKNGVVMRITRKTTSDDIQKTLGAPDSGWEDGTERAMEYNTGSCVVCFTCDDPLNASGRVRTVEFKL